MMKRFMALLMSAVLSILMLGCGSEAELSAIARAEGEGVDVVYIDDEAIALAGSVKSDSMTEAEKQRADELRAMAVEAFDLVNAKRAEAGLPALVWDGTLEACAQVRATEIQTKFSHTRPNGSDWYTVNSDLMWGENLAKGYKSASSVVNAWMNSATHKANIMDGGFVTCSIAVYEMNNKLYFAQEFGY